MRLTPDSRVVCLDLHDHVRGRDDLAVFLGVVQDVDVAAGGVAGVDDAAVPGAVAFLEDVHVVAVVVEAVRRKGVLVLYIVDRSFWREGDMRLTDASQ